MVVLVRSCSSFIFSEPHSGWDAFKGEIKPQDG